MSVSPLWRNRLAACGAALLALWLGAALAQQDYFWPMLVGGLLAMMVLTRLLQMPIDVILLGGVICGYIAGNRGFAQISLVNFFPLLPAEFVLLVAGTSLVVNSAFRHINPVHRDGLNLAILGWMLIGGIRLVFDAREHGFMAIRDFATVYYAAFFFIAQSVAKQERHRDWLLRCMLAGCAGMLVFYPLVEWFPGFFFDVLVLRGNPLIFYKGDLVGTMLVAGGVLVYFRHETARPLFAAAASLVLIGVSLLTNNRASLVALVLVLGLLVLARRWRFAAILSSAGAVAVVAILFFAYLTNTSWRQTPLHGVYERAVSVIDFAGEKRYTGDETYFKGDNNRYRMVWWKAVVTETIAGNPWFGLGFGSDLASRFVTEYYPEQDEEFDVRSPHNVVLTMFGRTGLAGTLPFVVMMGLVTWRMIKSAARHDAATGIWGAALIILISACFGVVLEGPMGAVVFWSLLGLASATPADPQPAATKEIASPTPEPLPKGTSSV